MGGAGSRRINYKGMVPVRATVELWWRGAPAVAAATLIAGCGINDPYAQDHHPSPRRPSKAAYPTGTAAASPEDAARQVAIAYGNWTSATVGQSFRRARARAI